MFKIRHALQICAVSAFLMPGANAAHAASINIDGTSGPQFGDFAPGAGGDVFSIEASAFGVTAPLSFQSGVFGNIGISAENLAGSADDPNAIASDVNVVVIQNRDNDDFDGNPPANWNASWNARTSLSAIAANTTGDRAGFFLYWNEGLGVNRLFATDNLNDPLASLTLLFTDQSSVLTGVPGEFDLNLANGDPTRTDLFPEANANLAELALYSSDNFVFSDQVAPVPLPAGLPLLAAGLALFGVMRRRR
ncbi:MAG: VPLPA-CTERM sorting domain-containing protein [Pseudomonadota bacterium]